MLNYNKPLKSHNKIKMVKHRIITLQEKEEILDPLILIIN